MSRSLFGVAASLDAFGVSRNLFVNDGASCTRSVLSAGARRSHVLIETTGRRRIRSLTADNRCGNRVALAGGRFQPLAVDDRDEAATIRDETGSLQRACDLADRRARGPQHHRDKL